MNPVLMPWTAYYFLTKELFFMRNLLLVIALLCVGSTSMAGECANGSCSVPISTPVRSRVVNVTREVVSVPVEVTRRTVEVTRNVGRKVVCTVRNTFRQKRCSCVCK